MTVSEIRTALKTAAVTVNEVRGLGKIRGFAYPPDTINPPTFFVGPHRIDFDLAFNRGTDLLTFDCVMVVERQSERTAYTALDTYVSALKTALESDQTLGGKAYSCRLSAMSGYLPQTAGNESSYRLAAPLTVEVHASTV